MSLLWLVLNRFNNLDSPIELGGNRIIGEDIRLPQGSGVDLAVMGEEMIE